MRRGIDAVGTIPAKVKDAILKIWEADFDGYRFHPEILPGIFNPTQAMYNFEQLRDSIAKGEITGLTADDHARELLQFKPDRNTLPAESTLRVISSHPLGRATIRKVLTSSTLKLSSPLMSRFRLSAINELSTNSDALLSFMFYTGTKSLNNFIYRCYSSIILGALTYCPPSDSKRKMSADLKVTNETARNEFWNEALRMSSWLSSENLRKKVYGAIGQLVSDKNIVPLCDVISAEVLSKLEGNNVVHHQESSLVQGTSN